MSTRLRPLRYATAALLPTALLLLGWSSLTTPSPSAEAQTPRQDLKCHAYCLEDDVQAMIEKAGTTPTRIFLGDMFTELSKPLVIQPGADITIVNYDGSGPEYSNNSGLVRANGGSSTPLIKVAKGASLTLDQNPNGRGQVIIDSRAQYSNAVTASSFGPTVLVEGDFTMNNGSIQGARRMQNVWEAALTITGEGATFTLNGGKVTDNQRRVDSPGKAQHGAANVAVNTGAKMVMNGGEVSKGRTAEHAWAYGETGGIGVFNGGELTVNGGLITDNRGWVGNIHAYSWLDKSKFGDPLPYRSRVTINDGEITKGHAQFGGGGVGIFGDAEVTMNGGRIAENTASNGGGVNAMDLYVWGASNSWEEVDGDGRGNGYTTEDWSEISPGAFTMNGGEITGNSATRTGGGVNVISNKVTLLRGRIADNTADNQGGGIYVATHSYTANLKNTLVSENTAGTSGSGVAKGGGIWLCPTGELVMHVTDGAAILNNTAPVDPASATSGDMYGDDIAHDNLGSANSAHLELDSRMLGGGQTTYFKDGGTGKPRFDAAAPGREQVFQDVPAAEQDPDKDYRQTLQNAGLKMLTSEENAAAAAEWAQLVITGNRAPRGGGIGSNGTVVFGTPEDTEFPVLKKWQDQQGNPLPEDSETLQPVLVQPMGTLVGRDEEPFPVGDPVELNKDNNWSYTFTDLPTHRTIDGEEVEIRYSLAELDAEGFEVTITGDHEAGFTVANVPTTPPSTPPTEPPSTPPTTPPTEPPSTPPTTPPTEPPATPPVTPPGTPPGTPATETTPPPATPGEPPSTPPSLAETGVQIAGVLLAAAALISGGALLIRLRRNS